MKWISENTCTTSPGAQDRGKITEKCRKYTFNFYVLRLGRGERKDQLLAVTNVWRNSVMAFVIGPEVPNRFPHILHLLWTHIR